TPELQPAENLWALVDEPIVNQHIAIIAELDEKIAAQCIEQMRLMYAQGMSQHEIAAHFHVNQGRVSHAVNHKS
ncbi:MAG: hypothetical protein ACRED2_09050, partial [Methylocella sp.]